MSPSDDPMLAKVLKAIDAAERENSPANLDLIAEQCGIEVDGVKSYLAEAKTMGLAYFFKSTAETGLPTAPGWTLTLKGQAIIEADKGQ